MNGVVPNEVVGARNLTTEDGGTVSIAGFADAPVAIASRPLAETIRDAAEAATITVQHLMSIPDEDGILKY